MAAGEDRPSNQDIAAELELQPTHRRAVARTLPRQRASPACKTTLAPAGPGAFPPYERLCVITLASGKTEDHQTPDSAWSLDELAMAIVKEAHHKEMSRSTIQRILALADLKPHKSVYWLNSHDPDFKAKAEDICGLYLNAQRHYEQGRLVLSCDEKTGMQILSRKYPTQPARPAILDHNGRPIRGGQPAKREFEYARHGTRCLLTTFCVPTGEVIWDLGKSRTSLDWVAHLRHVREQFPDMRRFDWVVDNLNTHYSLDVCRLVAEWCKTPAGRESVTDRGATQGVPERPQSSARVPLHADTRLVAEPGGVVLQRVVAAAAEARRLQIGGRVRGADAAVAGGLQCQARPPVSLDVHGGAAGAGDAVQPDAAATAARASRIRHASSAVRAASLPAPSLQTYRKQTGCEFMKWSSRAILGRFSASSYILYTGTMYKRSISTTVLLIRAYDDGSVWESNPHGALFKPPAGFEDRGRHQIF